MPKSVRSASLSIIGNDDAVAAVVSRTPRVANLGGYSMAAIVRALSRTFLLTSFEVETLKLLALFLWGWSGCVASLGILRLGLEPRIFLTDGLNLSNIK
jgi:hypothetical protein